MDIFGKFRFLLMGMTAVVDVQRHSRKTSVQIASIVATTFSVLILLFTWTATSVTPVGAIAIMALVPAISWVAFSIVLRQLDATQATNK